MTDNLIFIAAISAYILFVGKFLHQSFIWFRVSSPAYVPYHLKRAELASAFVPTILDMVFFRRVFAMSKMLWVGSWLFHISFLFVVLRHLRYFFTSIPDCVVFFQPVGVAAGYLLPSALLFLLVMRAMKKKDQYVSAYNRFISSMLLFISLSGLLMRNYFRADLLEVKRFTLGIMALSPQSVPDDLTFLFHVGLFILLLPFLPVHLFAAPLVTLEANMRSEGLKYIIHEK